MNVSFVGCGAFCGGNHIPNAHRNPELHITAFCDLDEERLDQLAATYEPAYVTTDMERLFSDPEQRRTQGRAQGDAVGGEGEPAQQCQDVPNLAATRQGATSGGHEGQTCVAECSLVDLDVGAAPAQDEDVAQRRGSRLVVFVPNAAVGQDFAHDRD